MLEFDDIQYILLTRVPALTGRYEFLSFRSPLKAARGLTRYEKGCRQPRRSLIRSILKNAGCPWRSPGMDYAPSVWMRHHSRDFPEEFRQGMAARWQVLGDTGTNHPTIGPEALVGRSFTRSPFSLLAMPLKESEAFASTRHYWRAHPA